MSELDADPAVDEAEEQLFERLLERYDEASALGLPVSLPKPGELSPERHRELERLARRIDLVNQAAREQALGANGARPEPELVGASDPFAGELIGRFRVLRELGRGGYGVVFLAYDSGIGRLVAVKLPRPEVLVTPELRARFLREAQAAGRIDHPHVLPVHEAAEDAGMCYLVTPYCRGLSLAEWFAEHGPAPAHDVARLGASLADALACAHGAGVLHRDLKPANILLDLSATDVTADREALKQRRLAMFLPRLTDFGLAKLLEESELATRTGALVGTPSYMAPEQVTGRLADARTDVYALGVVMYELLTGKLPADASALAGLPYAATEGRALSPRRLCPEIPRDLEAVVLKCLEPAAADRYGSAAALAEDLNRFLAGKPTVARPAGPLRKCWKAARRRPALAIALGLLVVAIASLVGGERWYAARLNRTESILQARLYAADIRQAKIARRQGSLEQARQLLERYASGQPTADLRGFEWHWMRHSLEGARLTINARHGEAYAVVVANDGRTVYSGGQDGVIRAWNLADGTLSHELHGHDQSAGRADRCVNQLDLSPDGQTLASVSCDGTVRLWDVAAREQRRVLVHSDLTLTSLDFANHHAWLAVDTHAGMIQVWDTESGAMLAELGDRQEHQHVDAVAFSPDDRHLVGTLGNGITTLWETSTWTPLRRHEFRAISLAFVGDGSQLVLGSRDWLTDLVGWNVATGQRSTHVGKLPANAQCVVGMRGDEVLFAGSANGALKAFRLSNDLHHVLPTGQARLQSLSLSRDDRYLAAAGFDGLVRVWDLEQNRWPVNLDSAEPIAGGILSPDTRWLAINTTDGELYLWDCQHRRQAARVQNFAVRGFSASGGLLICETPEGATAVLATPTLRIIEQVDFRLPLVSACVSAEDRFVALLSSGGKIEVTDLHEGKVCFRMQIAGGGGGHPVLALSDDGSKLLVMEDGRLPSHAIEVATGRRTTLPEDQGFLARSTIVPQSGSVSPDGCWKLNFRDDLGECNLEHLVTGETRGHLGHRDFAASSRAWSPDGKRLFVGTRIGELIVVDTATGTQLCELDTPLGRIASPIACSPDGERIMVFTTDGRGTRGYLHVWAAPRED